MSKQAFIDIAIALAIGGFFVALAAFGIYGLGLGNYVQ